MGPNIINDHGSLTKAYYSYGDDQQQDGDEVNVRWWQYHEVDTYSGRLSLPDEKSTTLSFRVPDDLGAGETIHLVVEAYDKGTPVLTRYRRVILRGR